MSFNEKELEEIESTAFLIKSVLNEIGQKIIDRNISEENIPKCLELSDNKELISRLFEEICNHLSESP